MMSRDADAPPVDSSPPGDAADTFTLLSDETRVAIVRALADAPAEALGFSELRSRVGVRDGGRFNYHLQKLCGSLVEKRTEGYALTAAGERAARLL